MEIKEKKKHSEAAEGKSKESWYMCCGRASNWEMSEKGKRGSAAKGKNNKNDCKTKGNEWRRATQEI